MKTDSIDRSELERLDEGDWLNRMLADIRREIAGQPSQDAVRRIRSRVLKQMSAPTRAAA